MDQYQKTVGKGYISLPMGNHDNARLGNKRTDKELEIVYAFGFTMPGVPFLYYGNEIGMRQLPTSWPQVEGAYQPRNGARTPMQWSQDKNLGFSTGDASKLYLPVDPSPDAPNVATQEKNPNSLLNKTRRLIALHHSEPALANYSEFVPLYPTVNSLLGQKPLATIGTQELSTLNSQDPYPFVYARAAGNEVVLVMLNPRAEVSDATFPVNIAFKRTKLLAGDRFPITRNKKTGYVTISMPATSYAIVKLE
jgi:maltose alpha-D-glucosyltransferase/alpha-amylase